VKNSGKGRFTLPPFLLRIASRWHPYTFVTRQSPGYESGLGNKFFVLAAAADYAARYGTELVVEKTSRWGVSLSGADHEASRDSRTEDLPASLQQLLPAVRFEAPEFIAPLVATILNDDGVHYNLGQKVAHPRRRNAELRGYFLHADYFHHRRAETLKLLRFPASVYSHVRSRYGAWIQAGAIGVHVRRGDRATNDTAALRAYYARAIALFPDNARFLVISDDIAFCRDELFSGLAGEGRVQFVQGERHFVDLLAFSLCQAQVIADSTFSWWGAYLSEAFPRNRVICPASCWLDFPHWEKLR
jgi:Glycosyl transferase family 11